jgi:hypothetical protein
MFLNFYTKTWFRLVFNISTRLIVFSVIGLHYIPLPLVATWKRAKFSFRRKPTWLQETGAAAAGAARGFHWIKVTRSLAVLAILPSKGPWTKIRATLFLFSAVSGRRNDSAIS